MEILVKKPSKRTNPNADSCIEVFVSDYEDYRNISNDEAIEYAKDSKHYNSASKHDDFRVIIRCKGYTFIRIINMNI